LKQNFASIFQVFTLQHASPEHFTFTDQTTVTLSTSRSYEVPHTGTSSIVLVLRMS